MQFIRNVNEEPVKVNEEVKPSPVVEPVNEIKVEEAVAVEPSNSTVIVDEKVEDNFEIPVFEQTTFVHNQVAEIPNITAQEVSEPVVENLVETEVECLHDSEVDVATEGVTTAKTDGEQLKFDLNTDPISVVPETEIIQDVAEKVETPTVEIVEEVKEDNEPKSNKILNETWNKFVDAVVVPTLTSCMEKIKNYIEDEVAKDLKKIDPTK